MGVSGLGRSIAVEGIVWTVEGTVEWTVEEAGSEAEGSE